jgi:hypothetical protein
MRPVQLYLLLVGFHFGQLLWYAPRLPAVVPSHFDAAGVADGWMAKGPFLGFLAGVTVLYLGVFFLAVAAVRKAPASLINLPNKDWWLAPERGAETRRTVVSELFKMAAATQALHIAITQLSAEVALGLRPGLGRAGWVALAAYLAIVLWWVVALYRRFRRPGGETAAGDAAGGGSEPS